MTPVILEQNTKNLAHIDLFSKLMSDRIIFIDTVINDESVSILQAQLLYLCAQNTKNIKIYINSPGGSVYAGLGLYDIIQFVKKTCIVETVNVGMAASMAAILLASGTKGYRFALKHSRTMIHQPMGGVEGQVSDIKIVAKEIMNLQKELYDILVEDTNQTYEVIERDCDRDFWFRAQEAIDYGLIDAILI